MGDAGVSGEIRQGVRGRGKHSNQLKSAHFPSMTSRQEAENEECFSSAEPAAGERQHLTSSAFSHTEEAGESQCSSDSCAEAAAAASERGTPRSLGDSVAADTLSYFTLAESGNSSSFYFLGTGEVQDDTASSPSVFLWNPSEACVHEVEAGLGTCRCVYRLPAGVPLVAGVGGCCCVSAVAASRRQYPGHHRQKMKKRRKRDQTQQQEANKGNAGARALPSATLNQGDDKANKDRARASLPAEETLPRLLFILAENCRLRQFASARLSVATEAENQKEEENDDEVKEAGERGRNQSMEETLQEWNSLSVGGVIYAVYALPSSRPARSGAPGELSPSLCLVVHAPVLSRKEQQQEEQQQQNEQQGVTLEQSEKKQQQTDAAASPGQQRQHPNELHFAVVCCSSLKVLSTCVLPFPLPLSAAAAQAAAERERVAGNAPEDGKRRRTEARKEAGATDEERIEKVYLTGSAVQKQQQQQDVISLQVVVHVTTGAETGEALLNNTNGEKTPGEPQGESYCVQGGDRLQVDVCLQASLAVCVEKQEQRENTRLRSAAISSVGAGAAAASTAEDAAERVTIICRSKFCRLGEENLYSDCPSDHEAVSNSCCDSKRRRVAGDNSNCNTSSSSDSSSCGKGGSLQSSVSHSVSRRRGRRFVSSFPDWSPMTSPPTAVVDDSLLSPLIMLSQQHKEEFQLYSMETSTARLLLSKRYRSLLFPERKCHVRGAALLSGRYFIEWVRADETETECLLLLRELMWGAPCSPVYRLECSRFFEEPPVLLGSASYRRATAAAAVDVLWRGNGAVFSVPLPRPVVSHRRILGACAGFPLSAAAAAAGGSSAAAAVIRRKMKEDHALLLRAAAVGSEGRAADVAAALLSLSSSRRQQLQQCALPFEDAWTSNEEECRKTEKAICSVLKGGLVAVPPALVSYIIEHGMQHAAVQCCRSPLVQEASVVRFLLWRPAYFLPLVLGGQLSFSTSLLLQSLQEALAPGEGGAAAAAAVLDMLQLLSGWLKHYCSLEEAQWQVKEHGGEREDTLSTAAAKKSRRVLYAARISATAGRELEQRQEDIPPLQLILDFIAILVGARLPEMIMGLSLFKDEASAGETQEKKLLVKVLKHVQQLLEAADGKALRKVEGRIFAALSAQGYSAEDGGTNRELVEAFKVAL